MSQLYLGINLATALFLVAVILFVTIKVQGGGKGHSGKRQSGKSSAVFLIGGQDSKKDIRVVINFPPRIIKLLALSTEQKAQLQAILSRAEKDLLSAELEKQRTLPALQKAIMNAAFDEGAIRQLQGDLVAANAKHVQVNAKMFVSMRMVLTSEQVGRIRPELPLENNDFYLNVQVPEGFSGTGLSSDQNSQLQTAIHSREQRMIALARQAQAARIALEQTIFSEQFDEAAVNQRREELIAVIAEQIQVNTGFLLDARNVLTPDQLKRLDEMTPGR